MSTCELAPRRIRNRMLLSFRKCFIYRIRARNLVVHHMLQSGPDKIFLRAVYDEAPKKDRW